MAPKRVVVIAGEVDPSKVMANALHQDEGTIFEDGYGHKFSFVPDQSQPAYVMYFYVWDGKSYPVDEDKHSEGVEATLVIIYIEGESPRYQAYLVLR